MNFSNYLRELTKTVLSSVFGGNNNSDSSCNDEAENEGTAEPSRESKRKEREWDNSTAMNGNGVGHTREDSHRQSWRATKRFKDDENQNAPREHAGRPTLNVNGGTDDVDDDGGAARASMLFQFRSSQIEKNLNTTNSSEIHNEEEGGSKQSSSGGRRSYGDLASDRQRRVSNGVGSGHTATKGDDRRPGGGLLKRDVSATHWLPPTSLPPPPSTFPTTQPHASSKQTNNNNVTTSSEDTNSANNVGAGSQNTHHHHVRSSQRWGAPRSHIERTDIVNQIVTAITPRNNGGVGGSSSPHNVGRQSNGMNNLRPSGISLPRHSPSSRPPPKKSSNTPSTTTATSLPDMEDMAPPHGAQKQRGDDLSIGAALTDNQLLILEQLLETSAVFNHGSLPSVPLAKRNGFVLEDELEDARKSMGFKQTTEESIKMLAQECREFSDTRGMFMSPELCCVLGRFLCAGLYGSNRHMFPSSFATRIGDYLENSDLSTTAEAVQEFLDSTLPCDTGYAELPSQPCALLVPYRGHYVTASFVAPPGASRSEQGRRRGEAQQLRRNHVLEVIVKDSLNKLESDSYQMQRLADALKKQYDSVKEVRIQVEPVPMQHDNQCALHFLKNALDWVLLPRGIVIHVLHYICIPAQFRQEFVDNAIKLLHDMPPASDKEFWTASPEHRQLFNSRQLLQVSVQTMIDLEV